MFYAIIEYSYYDNVTLSGETKEALHNSVEEWLQDNMDLGDTAKISYMTVEEEIEAKFGITYTTLSAPKKVSKKSEPTVEI